MQPAWSCRPGAAWAGAAQQSVGSHLKAFLPHLTQLREGLVPLLAELKSSGTRPDDSWLTGSYDTDKQAALCKDVCLDIGFDTKNGRCACGRRAVLC
jgi:Zn-dependent M32 family carboxypeptidase